MKAGVFITGTDTDVGKTWTTLAWMHRLRADDYAVAGMKPVAAGCERRDGRFYNRDALLIQAACSNPPDYAAINPYAFEAAMSPHLACGDTLVDLERIATLAAELHSTADWLVVEGAGGWYSPLDAALDNAGLARRLGLPVVVVVGMRLGCINHARLTVAAVEQAGLRCAGWIAVCLSEAMPGFDGNLAYLQTHLPVPLLGVLPHRLAPDFAELAQHLCPPNWQMFDLRQNF